MEKLPALNFENDNTLPELDFTQELPELFPDETTNKSEFSFVQGKPPTLFEKVKNKISDMFAPPDPRMGPLSKEDFEAFKPADVAPKLTRTETAIKEGIFEGLIKPTLKAVPRVTGTAAGSLALLPGAGIRSAIELIPTVSPDPDKLIEPGSIDRAGKVFNEIMETPGKLITTPEEAEGLKNIGYAMKPFEMAGEGWGQIGKAINDALKDPNMPQDEDPIPILEPFFASIGEASAVFGTAGIRGVLTKIKNSNSYRILTIPERRLVVQSLAETMQKNPNMTEAQILRQFDNPQWRAEALKVRGVKTEPDLPPLFNDAATTGPVAAAVSIKEAPITDRVAVKEPGIKPLEMPPPLNNEPYSYEGAGYKVTEVKTADTDAKTKWRIDIDPDYTNPLKGIIDQVEAGSPGGRMKVGEGPESEWIGYSSTYPEFMKNRFSAKETVTALNKALEGKPLGIRQAEIVESALEYINEEMYYNERKALEDDGIERTEIERIQREGESEASEEFARQMEAEFAEAERRAKQETDGSAKSIIDDWADFFDKARSGQGLQPNKIPDLFEPKKTPSGFADTGGYAVSKKLPVKGFVVKTQTDIAALEKDPEWFFGKNKGDKKAADRFAQKNWPAKKTEQLKALLKSPEKTVFISQPSTSGQNVHPIALAEKLANDLGGTFVNGDEYFTSAHEEEAKSIPKYRRAFSPRDFEPVKIDELKNTIRGKNIVVVDDIFTSGGSSATFIKALQKQGLEVETVVGYRGDARLSVDSATLIALHNALKDAGIDIPASQIAPNLTRSEARDIIRYIKNVRTENAKRKITQDLRRISDRGTAEDVRPESQPQKPEGVSQRKDSGNGQPGEGVQTGPSVSGITSEPDTQSKTTSTPKTYSDTGGYAANVKSILQLPEIVKLAKELSGGKYPHITQKLSIPGTAGRFFPSSGKIALGANIFKDPAQAAAILAHEIGHLVDWLPDHLLTRGNILGRIASLKNYLKHTLPNAPGKPGALTEKERAHLRYLAEKLAAKENDKWIDEVITKEMPVSPEDVLAIWNDVERAKLINPELYDYVARLSTPEKKSIVKDAMKGVSPEQLKNFTKTITEKTGKRIKQKQYDEVDGKQVPQEWFKQKIREKYAELINKEIVKRRLFNLDEIENELKALSRAWKPFDPAQDAMFTAYRYSGPELYADAFSALLNAPGLLKSIAPRYYEAFFNYMQQKPEVKRLYDEIQDSINSGTVQKNRVENLRKMFRRGDDAYAKALEKTDRKISDMAMRDLVDANHAILHKVRMVGERNVPAGENPRYRLEEMAYSGSEAELYITTVAGEVLKPLEDNGMAWDTLGEYMYHLRVSTERAEMANPHGWTPELSAERIQEMKKDLGPEKFKALEDALDAFRKMREDLFIKKAEEAHVFSPELMAKIKDNKNYATFDVIDYIEKRYGRGSGVKIHKQIGTLNEVANPATATIMKDISLIKSINRQIAARSVVEFIGKHYPGEIAPAEKKWNGKYHEITEPPQGSDKGLIVVLTNGEAKGYYVDKWIAETFDKNPYESQFIAKLLSKTVQPFRLVFTELNYGFWLFNIFRDYMRAAKMLPGNSLVKFAKHYLTGIKPAFKSVYGIPDPVITEMQKKNMLISVADVRGLRPEDTQLERLLAMYRVTPGKWETGIRKPFGKMFYYFTNIGRAFERTTKVASYKYMLEKFPGLSPHEIGHIVRVRGGSPDFLRLGRGYPIYNNLLMFSNAMKEGYRGDYEAFTDKPGEFIWKQAKYTWIPKLLMKAAAIGLLGGTIKAIFEGVSEYDKTNYYIIPLGLTKSGKAVYMRVPQDETSRFMGGIFWKMISGDIDDMTTGLFDYMAGQAPTVNPSIDMLAAAVEYAAGQNPYDHFRGDNAIPEQIFEAGGARKHEAFLKWMAQKAGASIVYRFENDDVDKVKTELEKVLGFPIVSNAVGRFIKVSNTGVREVIREDKKELRSENARQLLDAKDALNKLISGDKINNEDLEALLNKPDVINRNIAVALARKYGNVYLEEFMTAQSNKEKAVVLKRLYDREMLLQGNK